MVEEVERLLMQRGKMEVMKVRVACRSEQDSKETDLTHLSSARALIQGSELPGYR